MVSSAPWGNDGGHPPRGLRSQGRSPGRQRSRLPPTFSCSSEHGGPGEGAGAEDPAAAPPTPALPRGSSANLAHSGARGHPLPTRGRRSDSWAGRVRRGGAAGHRALGLVAMPSDPQPSPHPILGQRCPPSCPAHLSHVFAKVTLPPFMAGPSSRGPGELRAWGPRRAPAWVSLRRARLPDLLASSWSIQGPERRSGGGNPGWGPGLWYK